MCDIACSMTFKFKVLYQLLDSIELVSHDFMKTNLDRSQCVVHFLNVHTLRDVFLFERFLARSIETLFKLDEPLIPI